MEKLKGVGVALITPFKKDLSVDYDSLNRVVSHVISGGVDYLVVQGTTGEPATLTKAEKRENLDFIKKINRNRLPLVYGIGGNNTQQVIEDIKDTDFQGVDAILTVSPYYNKPSQTGIVRHYEKIADESPVPVILYNVPGRTMSNMSAATTLTLANHPNIIAMKEASGDIEQCMQIAHKKPEDFLLLSGDDMMTLTLRAMGGVGVISVIGNAYPSKMVTMMHASLKDAREAAFSLLEINPLLYEESNPVGVKTLMHHMGICEPNVRLPLVNASMGLSKRIREAAAKIPSDKDLIGL
ncbi:4-hydroxy-tetrahydrodipicolinate synthase [Pleomorphovibrio marinus]|uniref:4-hydroxy-tetrahydrodipicolinate synthase n=1 Tax=Pleomorphovibrio marinus TaxID=2164132 RepID=UPI000E0BAA9D|nr:4-hydroxy-tetrahydrodipicolinate synthase [Pleomorphovibrio marinus]